MDRIYQEEIFKRDYNNSFKENCVLKSCLCGSKKNKILFKYDRYNLLTSVALCLKCGLVYTNKILSHEKLIKFYSSDSYRFFYNVLKSKKKNIADDKYIDDQIFDEESTQNSLSIIKKIYKSNSSEVILEFGSGYAQISRSIPRKGKLVCIDYSEKAISYLKKKGIEAHMGGIDVLDKLNYQFDLIILNHVVEHFYDFKNELSQIIKYLKKDGMIYIEVPNLDSKYNLDQFQNAHNYYFTKNTLLYYTSQMYLKSEYLDEKVNGIHLGVIFSKNKNQSFVYDQKKEIEKIIIYNKNFLTLGNFIKKKKSEIYEIIKFVIGISLTVSLRKFIAKLRTW
ncbi:class I SAM-dependent methyltransferase [Alphaproteobacteria bacterium]|nr:class I SAM-dependent methyltransferase [Alphaproteobacteria bacterium]